MMHYKGYSGIAEIAFDTSMIYGRVVGLRDVVTFQGETVAEAQQAFHDSVDDYLELCASRNEAPEKPFSGKFMLRIRPELHRTLVIEAQARKSSLNALIEETLAAAFPSTSVDTDTAEDEQSPRRSKAKALDQSSPA
jgi:predicted HicB family RNase H-like nuclease